MYANNHAVYRELVQFPHYFWTFCHPSACIRTWTRQRVSEIPHCDCPSRATIHCVERKVTKAEVDDWIDANYPKLVRQASLISTNRDGDDLLQEVMKKLYFRLPEVMAEGDPTGYILTAVRQQNVSWWRKRRREIPTQDFFMSDSGEDLEDRVIQADAAARIEVAVRELPERQRMVIVMRYLQNMTWEQIVHRTGWSRGTCIADHNRAIRTLRRLHEGDVTPND